MKTQNNVCLLLSNLTGRRLWTSVCWIVLLSLFNENNAFNSLCCRPCAKGWTDRLECPCKNRRQEQMCLHRTQSQAVVNVLEQYCSSNFESTVHSVQSTVHTMIYTCKQFSAWLVQKCHITSPLQYEGNKLFLSESQLYLYLKVCHSHFVNHFCILKSRRIYFILYFWALLNLNWWLRHCILS